MTACPCLCWSQMRGYSLGRGGGRDLSLCVTGWRGLWCAAWPKGQHFPSLSYDWVTHKPLSHTVILRLFLIRPCGVGKCHPGYSPVSPYPPPTLHIHASASVGSCLNFLVFPVRMSISMSLSTTVITISLKQEPSFSGRYWALGPETLRKINNQGNWLTTDPWLLLPPLKKSN